MKASSGIGAQCWRVWRHCCCRNGWYPLFVVPIVTLGCWFSLYTTIGCNFVKLDVGFDPVNPGWTQRRTNFGLFYYNSEIMHENEYRHAFHNGCMKYNEDFESTYIDEDRTFRMARVMGYISCGASVVAMLSTWLFVVAPIPARFFWPGLLLPSVMAAFIAEGSKFLLFDTALCRNALWIRGGSLLTPEVAESCSLGETTYFTIAAGVVQFAALCCVCLFAPSKRELDPDYGLDDYSEDDDSVDPEANEDPEGASAPVEGIETYPSEVDFNATTVDDESLQRTQTEVEKDQNANRGLTVDTTAQLDEAAQGREQGGLSPVDCIAETMEFANDLVCSPMHAAIEAEPTKQ